MFLCYCKPTGESKIIKIIKVVAITPEVAGLTPPAGGLNIGKTINLIGLFMA